MSWQTLYVCVAGLVIGVIVAAPIGAVNLICIRRTLTFGALHGFLVGLGAAIGDGLFAAVAGYGVSNVSEFIMRNDQWLKAAGGLFLLVLAAVTFTGDPTHAPAARARDIQEAGSTDLPHAFVASFVLAITNPATLLAFTAIIAGLANTLPHALDKVSAFVLVLSVFAGSTLWWFVLTLVVGLFHGALDERWLTRLNHASGVLIGIIGLAVLGSLVV